MIDVATEEDGVSQYLRIRVPGVAVSCHQISTEWGCFALPQVLSRHSGFGSYDYHHGAIAGQELAEDVAPAAALAEV